jgi:hypothetical protein
VSEYLLGPAALLERLAVQLSVTGARGHRVRWDQLDVSDPRRPRLTCAVDELAPLAADSRPA